VEILVPIAIALTAFIGLALVSFMTWSAWQFYKILKSLRDEIKVMNSSLTGVPSLMEGIKRVCAELASNTLSLGGSVNILKKSLIDESSDPRRPGVMQYDDEAADRAYQRQIIEQNEALLSDESNRFIVGE
jgi:hypothetical protein